VNEASSAMEALQLMLAAPPSIMVLDLRAPGLDDFRLMERVRAKWPQTAIIMAIAADDVEAAQKTQQAGSVDYVIKPFEREVLRQALERAVAAGHTQRE
jgi:CheY-like chemotaxis protein